MRYSRPTSLRISVLDICSPHLPSLYDRSTQLFLVFFFFFLLSFLSHFLFGRLRWFRQRGLRKRWQCLRTHTIKPWDSMLLKHKMRYANCRYSYWVLGIGYWVLVLDIGHWVLSIVCCLLGLLFIYLLLLLLFSCTTVEGQAQSWK